MVRKFFKKSSVCACIIFINSTAYRFLLGGGQNFERRNVERLTFRNFKIANIKIAKDEIFDSFIIKFIFMFRNYLNS